ncbi:MAG: hypothetical protein AABW50_01855 [Nanoarchaeota archaeon]
MAFDVFVRSFCAFQNVIAYPFRYTLELEVEKLPQSMSDYEKIFDKGEERQSLAISHFFRPTIIIYSKESINYEELSREVSPFLQNLSAKVIFSKEGIHAHMG